MNMQVSIYLSGSNQIHVVLQGQAQGAAAFRDFDAFVRFIEGCQEFINRHNPKPAAFAPIPKSFLDAFQDEGKS